MATVAVACKLNALGANENVDAGAVERGAEGVGVQRLSPLVIGLLVAVAAVLGVGKGACGQEVLAFDGCVAGGRNLVLAEGEGIGRADFVGL